MLRLLKKCYGVFCEQLASWMVLGHLSDPYGEFFIFDIDQKDPTDVQGTPKDPEKKPKKSFWSLGRREEMMPAFVDPETVESAIFVGRVLHALASTKSKGLGQEAQDRRPKTPVFGSPMTRSTPKSPQDYKNVSPKPITAEVAFTQGLLGYGKTPNSAVETQNLNGMDDFASCS